MRDRELREWRKRVRARADQEWRHLSLDVVDELAGHLADVAEQARHAGASEDAAQRAAFEVLNASSFLEISKPQPVVLYELAKGFLTGDTPELGETQRIER